MISNTSKFEKLHEDPTFKREASLQHFLCKLKQKNFFNENEYRLYLSGSAPTHIYATPKMNKFSSSDTFPKLCPIISSIGTFNYERAGFLWDLLSPIVPDDTCKDTFFLFLKVRTQIFPVSFLFPII